MPDMYLLELEASGEVTPAADTNTSTPDTEEVEQ
jgi:hypothetical protein